jgi:hypothetical protein
VTDTCPLFCCLSVGVQSSPIPKENLVSGNPDGHWASTESRDRDHARAGDRNTIQLWHTAPPATIRVKK